MNQWPQLCVEVMDIYPAKINVVFMFCFLPVGQVSWSGRGDSAVLIL
jgi:hypothetical protein